MGWGLPVPKLIPPPSPPGPPVAPGEAEDSRLSDSVFDVVRQLDHALKAGDVAQASILLTALVSIVNLRIERRSA